eukprot:scaffold151888_cov31-Tisochrysis_lutea.AAC.3
MTLNVASPVLRTIGNQLPVGAPVSTTPSPCGPAASGAPVSKKGKGQARRPTQNESSKGWHRARRLVLSALSIGRVQN